MSSAGSLSERAADSFAQCFSLFVTRHPVQTSDCLRARRDAIPIRAARVANELFSPVARRYISMSFEEGDVTSGAGALLLRQVDRLLDRAFFRWCSGSTGETSLKT
jgi:hypothetical protein